jgi:alkaline phosphatase
MISNGYSVVYDLASMNAVTSGKLFGLFAEDYMNYEQDRNPLIEPSIAQMTNKSIEILSQDPDGFFLMVEGGKIDLAAHDENKVNDALDAIAFDKAVKVALDFVETNTNTILIVTADHETEGLVVLSHDLNATLPVSLGTEEEKMNLRISRINNVTVDWTATYHTNSPVPVFCYGTAFSELDADITIDNTNIFRMMKDYFLDNPLSVTEVEPPNTTTTDTTITTSDTSATTSTIGTLVDPMMLTIAAAGAAVIVVVVLVLIRKR